MIISLSLRGYITTSGREKSSSKEIKEKKRWNHDQTPGKVSNHKWSILFANILYISMQNNPYFKGQKKKKRKKKKKPYI